MLADLTLLSCLAATLYMTGLIWFVQVVHYPLFARVDPSAFGRYHEDHIRLVAFVVMAPMLVELTTSVLLVARRPVGVGPTAAWLGLATVAITWASTALFQVPCHRLLAAGFDDEIGLRLVRTNWVRAASWTAHSAILLGMTAARMGR